ncbi:MAG: FixH family protein [Flavobacteriaceae bacterium]|nr:FixH family protein [Flavobacteriaceae bacterium]
MKFNNIYIVALIITLFVGCKESQVIEEIIKSSISLEDYTLTETMSIEGYYLEIYTSKGEFQTGNNVLYFKVNKVGAEDLGSVDNMVIKPVMNMMKMNHSCPVYGLSEVGGGIYSVSIAFQMSGNDCCKWSLTIDLDIDGETKTFSKEIIVLQAEKQNITTFVANETSYIMFLVEPSAPVKGVNDINIGLFKMENMMSFAVVEDYTMTLDPQMPSMAHGSPNNENPVFDIETGLYKGVLNMTMSGYWVLNMTLTNTEDNLVKGELLTDEVNQSSLFFEIEF